MRKQTIHENKISFTSLLNQIKKMNFYEKVSEKTLTIFPQ